jgi:hypothetical protein
MSTMEVGELLYEYSVTITEIIEYGVSFQSLNAGTALPPPEGARFDGPFEGSLTGPRLVGRIVGVDYVLMRADGRFQLHIHARITTDDGENIAFFADGVANPRQDSTVAELRENVTLSTSSKRYAWVNALQIWATGTLDFAEGVARLQGYVA